MRRFLAIAFFVLAMGSPSYAGLVSTASVNPFGPCGNPLAVAGTTSASVTVCTAPDGGTASTSINLGITSTTLATWNFYDGAGRSTSSESSSLFDSEFVVTGGSGAGFLTLDFVESNVSGDNDPQASANFEVLASLNGVQYSDVRICGNPPAQQGIVCNNPTDPIGVTFTYGTPFDLSVALNAVAGGGLANLVDFTTIMGDGTLEYSLPSPSDVITTVPAATTAPEPGSVVLLGTGLAGLAGVVRRRTVRKS